MAESRLARVAVIGVGGIGRTSHVPAISSARLPCRLVAVADQDRGAAEDTAAELPGVTGFRDPAEMLEVIKPDVVTIATPPASHARLAIQALRAGCWVIAEKPLCTSLSEHAEIREAETQGAGWCVTVSQFRYSEGVSGVMDGLRAGRWGGVVSAAAKTAWFRDRDYFGARWRSTYAGSGGGALVAQGHHLLDLLCYLIGPWHSVSAATGTRGRALEVEDTASLALEFDDGVVASCYNTVLSHRQTSELEIHCDNATLTLRTLYTPRPSDWHVWTRDGASPLFGADMDTACPPHEAQFGHVLDCWRTGRKPALAAAEAGAMVELYAATYKSARTGARVRRGEIQPGDPYYSGAGAVPQAGGG